MDLTTMDTIKEVSIAMVLLEILSMANHHLVDKEDSIDHHMVALIILHHSLAVNNNLEDTEELHSHMHHLKHLVVDKEVAAVVIGFQDKVACVPQLTTIHALLHHNHQDVDVLHQFHVRQLAHHLVLLLQAVAVALPLNHHSVVESVKRDLLNSLVYAVKPTRFE
jgi:hypothetical protein